MKRRTVIFTTLIASGLAGVVSAKPPAATGPSAIDATGVGPAATAAVAPAASSPTPPLERATADAVTRLYNSIASERVGVLSLGDIVDRAGAKSRIIDGLSQAEQIGGPRQIDDGIVQVNLEIRGDRVATIVRDAINQDPSKVADAQKQLARTLDQFVGRSFRGTGDSRSAEQLHAAAVGGATTLQLPDIPPGWTQDAQTASAVAPAAEGALKTARAAERAAREALRSQLAGLPLDPAHKLGDASPKTVDIAATGAKIASVDYRADGSVEVSVSIDGQQLWELLHFAADR